MPTLNQQKWEFADMVGELIEHARWMGYRVALGEAWRHPVMILWYFVRGLGSKNSFHGKKLAIDILLFKDGVYLTRTEDYHGLGIWWENRGGTWGGRFKRADGNHFSLGEK